MPLKPYWITQDKFLNVGWYDPDTCLKIVNNFTALVYSFCISHKCPKQDAWPWEKKETAIIGMAGGTWLLYRGDDKRGDRTNPTRKTKGQGRVETHINILRSDSEDIMETCESRYVPVLELLHHDPSLKIWINLLSPDVNTPEEIKRQLRTQVCVIEKEVIRLYFDRWGCTPIGCLEESPTQGGIKKDSMTDIMLRERTLGDFSYEPTNKLSISSL